MFAAASCNASIPPAANIRLSLPRLPVCSRVFAKGPNFIGSISEIPTPAPNKAALLRSSWDAPAALARSLASPAPAPIARPPAIGIPTPGIKAVAARGANDPSASPNLPAPSPSIISSTPRSGCSPDLASYPRLRINSRTGSSCSSGSSAAAPSPADSKRFTAPRPVPLPSSPSVLRIPEPSPGVADTPYSDSYSFANSVSF